MDGLNLRTLAVPLLGLMLLASADSFTSPFPVDSPAGWRLQPWDEFTRNFMTGE